MTTTKTLAQRRFDSLVTDHVAPLLKAAGFRKQGLNFRRRWGEEGCGGWHVINAQKSQWNDRGSISFTINLGLACDLYTRYLGNDPAKLPTEPECCWRMRIGHLMPDPQDHWWDLDGSRGSEDPAPEIVGALSELALPALAELSSLDGVRKALDRTRPDEWSPGWDRNYIIRAVLLRDNPQEQAKTIEAIRKAYSQPPHDPKKIEAEIQRLFAPW